MAPILTYESEPYRTKVEISVLESGEDNGRPFVVLSDTILYPEGGGQPADHGWLGDLPVVDVQRRDGVIRHYLDRAASGAVVTREPVLLKLDWTRRFDHMQQHTAQHLLTAIAADRFGWQTTSFHLQPDVCDIELDVEKISSNQLKELEDQVVAEILAAHPITSRRVDPSALEGLEVRSRGLPAGHRGEVRLVEIEGLDLNTCGGTHVRSTGELETLKLLRTEAMRGGTRLFWLAGARVRQRFGEHEARNDELRRILGGSDDELTGLAALKIEQTKTVLRQQKKLQSQLVELAAENLIEHPSDVLEAHFEAADASLLQQIAKRFSQSSHRGLAFLTASGEKGHYFVVVSGGSCKRDTQQLGREAAEILGARGGGSGKIFQGKADGLETRQQAFDHLERDEDRTWLTGDAEFVEPPQGVWVDRWVGEVFEGKIRTRKPIDDLTLNGFVPDFFPPQRTLLVEIGSRAFEVALQHGTFEFTFEISLPRDNEELLRLSCAETFQLKSQNLSDDDRRLAFKLTSILVR